MQIEYLQVELLEQNQFLILLEYLDLKFLKRLKVNLLTENEGEFSEEDLEKSLDLEILKGCDNLEEIISTFKINSPLGSLAHIPNLKMRMETICYEDIASHYKTFLKSTTSTLTQIFYDEFIGEEFF